jgi:hypothetical protein
MSKPLGTLFSGQLRIGDQVETPRGPAKVVMIIPGRWRDQDDDVIVELPDGSRTGFLLHRLRRA